MSAVAASPRRGTAAPIALLFGGALAGLIALALLFGGGMALYFATQRDSTGYVSTDPTSYSTGTYALVSDSYRAGHAGDALVPADVLGRIRIQATSPDRVFVGIGPANAVDRYLGGVAHETVSSFGRHHGGELTRGGRPSTPPAEQTFWAARASGRGGQAVTWSSRQGDWRIVVMNADGSRGVTADVAAGAEFPHIVPIGIGLLAIAAALGTGAGFLIAAGIRRV